MPSVACARSRCSQHSYGGKCSDAFQGVLERAVLITHSPCAILQMFLMRSMMRKAPLGCTSTQSPIRAKIMCMGSFSLTCACPADPLSTLHKAQQEERGEKGAGLNS
eukprot:1155857-Pelagomonas_calceolata.AAC.10